MGGVVDGGVGTNTSLWRAAIEKAQAELQHEYDACEERKRELDFLEKGGDPLDFKYGFPITPSIIQSISLAGQHAEQLGTSEGKGSFARIASPHGDSVESSGNAGTPTTSEPHTADSILLLDSANESCEGRRNSRRSSRINVDPSEQSFHLDVNQNHKEPKEGIAHLVKSQAYARRNRSKSHRDCTKMSLGAILPLSSACVGSRDSVVLKSQISKYRDDNTCSTSGAMSAGQDNDSVIVSVKSDKQVDASRSKGGFDSIDLHDCSHKNESDGKKTADLDSMVVTRGRGQAVLVGFERHTSLNQDSADDSYVSGKENGLSSTIERKKLENECQENHATIKGFDSESSCTQTSASLDRKNANELCINVKNVGSNGDVKDSAVISEVATNTEKYVTWKGYNETEKVEHVDDVCKDQSLVHQDLDGKDCGVKTEEDKCGSADEQFTEETKCCMINQTDTVSKDLLCGIIGSSLNEANSSRERLDTDMAPAIREVMEENISVGFAAPIHEMDLPSSSSNIGKISYEALILQEAKIIHDKRKGIAELSFLALPPEVHQKCHWSFLLEEMLWLANDFAQERVWKLKTSAYMCHQAVSAYGSKYDKSVLYREHKRVSRTLAQEVMQFWHSAECLDFGNLSDCQEDPSFDSVKSGRLLSKEKAQDMMMSTETKHRHSKFFAVQKYAARFLKENSTFVTLVQSEAPVTPNIVAEVPLHGRHTIVWENIIYTVPPRAMDTYRRLIESHFIQLESFICGAQEELDTSACDTTTDVQSESAGQGEAGDQSVYYLPEVLDSFQMPKFSKKKQKNIVKSSSRQYNDVGVDFLFDQCLENKTGNQYFGGVVKRPSESLPVGAAPTKRMRTAYKQRFSSPFCAGSAGVAHVPAGADASSGDTNSLHDDYNTLHGGCVAQRSLEGESGLKFDSQLQIEYSEISKPRKKKMSKHLSFSCDKRWKLESSAQNEQRDHLRKRPEGLQAESNGICVFSGQYSGKKPKIAKNSAENAFDSPATGSIPSPAASQMSNMSSPNKFIKMIGGRDRGRRSKILKVSAGHPLTGSPWTLFEDQALIVLVHDMGPNWEIVSDFLNSALQLKYIYRKSKECKARHKILMDRATGDAADSAEDSGSSQPYPFTLPGIPKGSARQLFQCLQGPMEEDTLMSHFEKIISIIKQQSYSNCQNEKREAKKLVPVHPSHLLALSQTNLPPNNHGGDLLTPLELIDIVTNNSDATPQPTYQNPQYGGISVSNIGPVTSSLDENTSLPGSSGVILTGNVPSPSGFLSGSVRDSRYNLARASSSPIEEPQRLKQPRQLLSGRNGHQASLALPGSVQGCDATSPSLPSGNSLSAICGMNRNVALSRPGLQVTGSSSILNSGNMLSSGSIGIPTPISIHSGAISSQGMSVLKTRDATHGMQSAAGSEHHRQMVMPDVQMHSQGNSQAVPLTGMNTSFSNQVISTVQAYPHSQQHQFPSPQQPHFNPHSQTPNTSAQQAYAFHLAKERHIQQQQHQRMLRQQQHQVVTSTSSIPQVHPHIPTSIQTPSQIQSKSCQPLSFTPIPSPPMAPLPSQKHQNLNHPVNRTSHLSSSGLTNQFGKQKQRRQQQQFAQISRPHPSLRPPPQPQQPAKLFQGITRANPSAPHNIPPDIASPLGSQDMEKGEQTVQSLNGCQSFYSCSTLNPGQPPKTLAPHLVNLSNPMHKLYSGMTNPMKQVGHLSSIPCNSNQGSVLSVPTGHLLPETHYSVNTQQFNQQHQPRQIQVNHCPSMAQRMPHRSWRPAPELPLRGQIEHSQLDRETASHQQVLMATTPPQPCGEPGGTALNASSLGSHWRPTDSLYEDSHLCSISGSSLKNSGGGEFIPASGQGLVPIHMSGGASLHDHGQNIGVQWQHKPHVQPSMPSSLPHTQQSQEQLQHQMLSQDLVVQKQLHQQTGQNSIYIRPSNSRIE